MLPKTQRLQKRLFSESFSHSKMCSNDNLTLRYKVFSGLQSKVSVVVSKKVAQKAVDRNLLKRKLYEIAQKLLKNAKNPYILMVFPKKGATTVEFDQLEKDLSTLFVEAKIL